MVKASLPVKKKDTFLHNYSESVLSNPMCDRFYKTLFQENKLFIKITESFIKLYQHWNLESRYAEDMKDVVEDQHITCSRAFN